MKYKVGDYVYARNQYSDAFTISTKFGKSTIENFTVCLVTDFEYDDHGPYAYKLFFPLAQVYVILDDTEVRSL